MSAAPLPRRNFLRGILAAGVAPFFVPVERLMRIKPIILPPEPSMGAPMGRLYLRRSDGAWNLIGECTQFDPYNADKPLEWISLDDSVSVHAGDKLMVQVDFDKPGSHEQVWFCSLAKDLLAGHKLHGVASV